MTQIPDPESVAPRRTLAAIVFTDVAGFSALMEKNEEHTMALVHRDLAVITSICQKNHGRVLKSTGDGLLMYFDSAVQAVACALEAQQALGDAARKAAPEDVLQHRVGIHLGDVFLSATDVMGDGVNVAARLQGEAEPGGVCISQTVYDVVKNRLAVQATFLGPRELKNIKEAVPVYQILLAAQGGAATGAPRSVIRKGSLRRGLWWWLGGAVLAGVIALVVLVAMIYARVSQTPSGTTIVNPAPVVIPPPVVIPAPVVNVQNRVEGGAGTMPSSSNSPTSSASPAETEAAARQREEVNAVRRQFMNRYNFTGMLSWLEKKGLKGSKTYERYNKLKSLKTYVMLVELPGATRTEPLTATVVNEQGPQSYEVWSAPDGGLIVKGPAGEQKMDFDELEAPVLIGLVRTCLKRLPQVVTAKSMELNEAASILVEECKFARLIPDSSQ